METSPQVVERIERVESRTTGIQDLVSERDFDNPAFTSISQPCQNHQGVCQLLDIYVLFT